jgi:hypothetical protein
VAEHRVLHLERRDRRAPTEPPQEPSSDGVNQEEEHRPMLRMGRRTDELDFLRPTGHPDRLWIFHLLIDRIEIGVHERP